MKEADINKTAIISRLKAYRERNGARAYTALLPSLDWY